MIKINHITILMISFLLFLGSIILLKKSNVDLVSSYYEYEQVKKLSSIYDNLKLNWDDKKTIDRKIDQIVSSLKIKNITITKKDNTMLIQLNNQSINTIDKFLNKILNNTFVVKSLDLQKDTLHLKLEYR